MHSLALCRPVQSLSMFKGVVSGTPLGGCLRINPVCLSCACAILNVPFNWWWPAAATAGSQQTCCVSLCTLSGCDAIISAINQANALVEKC